ncbi:hypothetical protein SAY87_031189 [Trapa incisa]|uniref:phospholipase D n=1 Tax=Trapa incisa TaxID=236973 RepID=A0AAN7QKJ9_9MYRT|nr:hypothetical protein SAY87_031189 [Trapa incisa]
MLGAVPSGPGCPRQPWHDLHCQIDGPAAYDILTNFEERWRHASKPHGIHKLKSSHNGQLLTLERIPSILSVSDVSSHDEDDPEGWHVQVFRSIDSNSVIGFPSNPKEAVDKNLVCGKNIIIDMSIQAAYIKAIRSAQHFIYIENQYFQGSSYNWDEHNDKGIDNLIPMEIALKIASKIEAKQRFSAYIVIPMFPEGVPTSAPSQRILYWQHKTMEMMYRIVYKALVEAGCDKEYEPQDFLTFFCLGTREAREIPPREGIRKSEDPSPSNAEELARKNRRFMIYVHSKGMIVDDEYVILGSANINQRSLDGSRDTEIAIGAYQHQHVHDCSGKGSYPKGQVHGYRMSLWAEHLGTVEECFKEPESLECMRRVRSLSEFNWDQYAADEVAEMKGHLLRYPLQVNKTVKVEHIPGCHGFPDVGVIVDADAGNNQRKLIAFIGGLDLCSGRYDTPSHPIFSTLETIHKDDYHNGTFTVPSPGCPRQPWHDLHCQVDGPAVYDILANFEERWLCASELHGMQKLKHSHNDQLLKLERITDILRASDISSHDEADREGWHVQVFRSIDSNSVIGFPNDPKDATKKNLVCGKNVLIDMSIQAAYIKAIRAAQHFLYIENQYFLGSSYNWDSYKDLGANNLIPMEIALKIASKIKAKQRFSAYIVIPMWPEGVPTTSSVQRILFWQRKTMEMMYYIIYEALVEAGWEKEYEPQDFLTFFCLGTREAPQGPYKEYSGDIKGPIKSQELAKKNRRFMIYVHSKGMIVDDEYVILGSANINQRSLEGSRDTEIAIGAYQPHHTYAKKDSYPKGQIHGYRMSLWAEHLGIVEECFKEPESLECMRRVRWMSESNWEQYVADEVVTMKGHLMKYPLLVDRMGKVKPIPGCETFPDVGGKIEGSFTAIQENLTI